MTIRTGAYRLHVDPRRLVAHVHGRAGRLWFRLRLLAALDTALYYATAIDLTGEPLRPEDLAAVARVWGEYRRGLVPA